VSELNETIGSEPPKGISRRTVTKAMAWSVPVIAVSAAVPAYAASRGFVRLDGRACKLPGNSADIFKGYAFGVVVQNNFNVPVTITIDDIILNNTDLGNVGVVNLSTCTVLGLNTFTVAANTTLSNLVLLTQNAASSEQGNLSITYSVVGGPGGGTTVTAAAPVTPPIQGAVCDDFTATEKQCIRTLSEITPPVGP
jgi:hypothetical protein